MAIVEDVTEAEEASSGDAGPSTTAEMLDRLRGLMDRMRLPEDLLPAFMQESRPVHLIRSYQDTALSFLGQVRPLVQSRAFTDLDSVQQAEIVRDIVRLYGSDPWSSPEIIAQIDKMLSHLSKATLAIHLLQSLRPVFSSTPHPMLNHATSRALPRPAGGPDAKSDFLDESAQVYKSPANWGSYNALSWAVLQISSDEVERYIGLLLPPTLVMMDDWEPSWRGRGVIVLNQWMDKLPADTMRRMGMDKLLLDTLIHTLTIHPDPPLDGVLDVTLSLLRRTTKGKEKERTERIDEIMDKAIIKGWMYAPPGQQGRAVVIQIARQVETMCEEIGSGVVRWLKSIIPYLLDPLQYTPSAAVFAHFQANLSALLCVMRTCRSTGRMPRWRGQILDLISRLWVQLEERKGVDDLSSSDSECLSELCKEVVRELAGQCPDTIQEELPALRHISERIFDPLVKAAG